MINNKIIYQVDSFTTEAFKGNPAGVMIVDKDFTEKLKQNIAMEMNLSETAFIVPNGNSFDIRFFTPIDEIPLCGHATLASAFILYETGAVNKSDSIIFNSKVGELIIENIDGWISMNLPRFPVKRIDLIPNLKDIIGFEPSQLYESSYQWKIAVAKCEEDIKNIKPNLDKLLELNLGHLMVTAKSEVTDSDFVVRCFVPLMGIPEDPVTGSAHCALTPLWADKLDKTDLMSVQLSERTGRLKLRLLDDRVEIKGQAKLIFKADLSL
ncbi:MAG: PhzF family phenazine biosynthesis protein [Spirochaetaceae bacterium]